LQSKILKNSLEHFTTKIFRILEAVGCRSRLMIN